MTTAELRSIVKAAATGTPHARIWPNGLGFDCRGTSYSYNERIERWQCAHTYRYHTKYGEGKTPAEAKRAAGIGRDQLRSRR